MHDHRTLLRHLLDGAAPMAGFLVGYVAAGLGAGVATAALVAVVVAAGRLRRGGSMRVVAVSAALVLTLSLCALLTGQGRNFYLPDLVLNGVLALAFGATVATRRPLSGRICRRIGVEGPGWSETVVRIRLHRRITSAWSVYWTAHLAAMVALYRIGDVVALGVLNLFIAKPAVFAMVVITWLSVRRAGSAARGAGGVEAQSPAGFGTAAGGSPSNPLAQ